MFTVVISNCRLSSQLLFFIDIHTQLPLPSSSLADTHSHTLTHKNILSIYRRKVVWLHNPGRRRVSTDISNRARRLSLVYPRHIISTELSRLTSSQLQLAGAPVNSSVNWISLFNPTNALHAFSLPNTATSLNQRTLYTIYPTSKSSSTHSYIYHLLHPSPIVTVSIPPQNSRIYSIAAALSSHSS